MKFSKKVLLICIISSLSIITTQLASFNQTRTYAATIRYVNQLYGPYTSITSAINASGSGDIVEITDSNVYYESFIIGPGGKNITNFTLRGKEGEQPVISGEGLTGSVIQLQNTGCLLKNLTIYVAGAYAGVDNSGSGNTFEWISFDNHIPGIGNTFCANVSQNTNFIYCNFLGNASISSGGILANTTTAIQLNVYRCDFYDTGTAGGMIGLGMAANSTALISECSFATGNTSNSIIAINNWGSGSIGEYVNSFKNVSSTVIGFQNNTPHSSDIVSYGNIYPSDSNVAMNDTILSNLIAYMGATNEYSWSYPTTTGLSTILNKAIRSEYYDQFDPNTYDSVLNISLKQNTLDLINYTNPQIWYDFSISWNRQFDPSVWARIKKSASEVKSLPNSSNIILQGYCMEAIGKTNINNTPMDQSLWLFVAKNFPSISFRPLEAKFINGRRIQGHWFNYDTMLGIGVNLWGNDVSVPNLNKQESLLYYIYLAKSYIDAGMNDVSFAQPQKTFGQDLGQYNHGGTNLQLVSRFARNYGHYFGSYINGQRYVICGLSTSYWYLQSYANYINYTRGPAGVSDNKGFGVTWNSLSDAWNSIPPADIVISGKPYICEMDNFGTNDQISTFAKTAPGTRNQFMIDFTAYLLSNRGFYIMQPGLEPINPTGCQIFTGYQIPPQGTNPDWIYPWAWNFQPFQEYGGFENTMKSIFDSH